MVLAGKFMAAVPKYEIMEIDDLRFRRRREAPAAGLIQPLMDPLSRAVSCPATYRATLRLTASAF